MPDGKPLTGRQGKAIPKILAAKTCEEGCQAAGISKACFYKWMKQETFRAEFESQRQKLVDAAIGLLAQNVGKAIETLVGLLDAGDGRLKRLAAKDVIEHYMKHKEFSDIEKRIEAMEERLQART